MKREIAFLLLTGIISDTIMLKSPTTTDADTLAVQKLAALAQVSDIEEFANQLFSNTTVLTEADAKSVIESDFKMYREGSVAFGIGQVEVGRLADVEEVKDRYVRELCAVRDAQRLDWTLLLITDVRRGNSVLLTSPFPLKEALLSYPLISPQLYELKGVLSRKKQVLPEVVRVLEEIYD